MHLRTLLLLCLIYNQQCGMCQDLPATFKKCRVNSNLNSCLQEAIQGAFVELRKGIPKFHTNTIDPMALDHIRASTPNLNQHYFDIKMAGYSKGVVRNVQAFVSNDTMTLNFTAIFQELVCTGNYELQGKLLAIPIEGKGKYDWTFANATFTFRFTGKAHKRNSEIYMIINDVFMDMVIGGSKMYADNFFNGNKALTDQMNNIMNANWQDLAKELKPSTLPVLSEAVKKYANTIFSNVPLNRIFIF